MNEMHTRPRVIVAAVVVTLVLAAGSTIALAFAGGAFRSGASAPNGQYSATGDAASPSTSDCVWPSFGVRRAPVSVAYDALIE